MDQPLYALAKKIQWEMKPSHGEDKFVIMFGGLHIEMAALKLIGDLLAGSGWTAAVAGAGIATAGTADSFLKANHVTKTRHAHQVNAGSLYLLLHKAYQDSQTCQTGDMVPMSLDDWCCDRSNENRQLLNPKPIPQSNPPVGVSIIIVKIYYYYYYYSTR